MLCKYFVAPDCNGMLCSCCEHSYWAEAHSPASPLDDMVSLDLVRACIAEILNEAQRSPTDCLHCIANDSLLSWRIPLLVEKNDEGPAENLDPPYSVSVDKTSKFYTG